MGSVGSESEVQGGGVARALVVASHSCVQLGQVNVSVNPAIVYKLFSGQGFSKWGHCPQNYFNMIKFVLHIAGIRGKFIEKGIRHHNCVTISQIITGKP
jgi:hypothetical protein